ncbi:cytochrome P450 monooxygenase [Abortiporus biennis]
MHELIGWSDNLAFLPYNDEWQKQRKLFQQQLSRKGVFVFQNIQLRAATTLLNNLLRDPDMFDDHCRRYATSVIMEIAYGHEIVSDDDPYLQIAKEVNNVVTGAGDPGATPPDLFPILKKLPPWFPGAWFIRYGQEARKVVHKVKEWPFREVIANMAAGTANESFLSLTLEELACAGNQDPEMVEMAKVAAAHFYAAGGDTTYSTILIFIFAVLLNPDAQKKAQKEIDEVIGNTRLPDFSDRDSLPMVECVINEAVRWHQAGPLAIPHRTMEEDTYRGYRIPKGAVVIGNVRGITLDESVYADPHCFYPERYLPRPAGNGEPHPASMYGFGRRVCPGRHLADNSVWIVGATILASFDIIFAKDENGCDIVPPEEFTSGLTSHPKPFRCNILPRSTVVKNIAHHDMFHVR